MKWIHAKERLPAVPVNASGQVVIRGIKNPNELKLSWYSELPNGRGGNSLLKKYPDKYEWLDEQPDQGEQDEFQKAMEEIERLKKLLSIKTQPH